MSIGKTMLGRRHVIPSVTTSLTELMVEGTFPMGTYLVTVHNPISSDDGDLAKALYGSFLPTPSQDLFSLPDPAEYEAKKLPGAVVTVKERNISMKEGRNRIRLKVSSKGDRPIQVCYLSMKPHTSSNPRLLGWLSLSFYRSQPATRIRQTAILWIYTRHCSRYIRSLRARRHQDGQSCRNQRPLYNPRRQQPRFGRS